MKRNLLLYILASLLFWPADAKEAPSPQRPKVAVVLAGGGARGLAHIKALEVIEEAGVPIDMIVGNSMGSIVAGLYAVGYNTKEMEQIVQNTNWMELLFDNPDFGSSKLSARKANDMFLLRLTLDTARRQSASGKGGVMMGRNIYRLFESLTQGLPDSIDFHKDLAIPFACVATDAITGKQVELHKGSLTQAMRASMAIPGVFTPIPKDSMLLVDGFVANNFPVDVARQMGADIIIGVDIVNYPTTDDQFELYSNALDLFTHLLDINSNERYQSNISASDIYIPINTTGFSSASFTPEAIDTLLVRGEIAARMAKPQLMRLHDNLMGTTVYPNYSHRLEHITYNSLAEVPADTIASINLGARFDNEEYASVLFRLNLVDPISHKVNMAVSGRLGRRLEGTVGLGKSFGTAHMFRLGYEFQHNTLDYYYKGDPAINFTNNRHRFQAVISHYGKRFTGTMGLRYDAVHYNKSLFGLNFTQQNALTGTNGVLSRERFFSYVFRLEYNTLDRQYFPTRGMQLQLRGDLVTHNLYEWHGNAPIPIISSYWTRAFRLSSRFVLSPQIQSRIIISEDSEVPFSLSNIVGGFARNMAVHHQMTMAGVPFMEYVKEDAAVIGGFHGLINVYGNHYVDFSTDVASFTNHIQDAFAQDHTSYGFNIGWSLKSFAGPISLLYHWSSLTHQNKVTISAGYYF